VVRTASSLPFWSIGSKRVLTLTKRGPAREGESTKGDRPPWGFLAEWPGSFRSNLTAIFSMGCGGVESEEWCPTCSNP